MTGDTEFPALERGTLIAATAVVAATWFYFLIYVHQGLMGLAADWTTEEAWRARGLLTWLGTGGVLGSVLAAWRFNVYRWRGQLSWSLRACAMVAALATMAGAWEALVTFAALTGLSLGWLTVTLATGLRPSVGTTKLGWVIGLGTGIAYAAANLPFVYEAEPARQVILAAVVVAAVSVLAPFLTPQESSVSQESVYGIRGVVGWMLMSAPIVVLCAMLGAAVFMTRPDPLWKHNFWAKGDWPFILMPVLLVSGALAGRMFDMGWRWRTWLIGGSLVVLGVTYRFGGYVQLQAVAMAAGTSISCTVLLCYLTRGGRAWTTAVVLSTVGWVGTSVGIGILRESRDFPDSYLPIYLAVAVVGSLLVGWANRQPLKTKSAD